MKEEKIKELMKEGLLKTSDGFTEDLMSKIEKESVPAQIPRSAKIALLVLAGLLFVIPLLWQMHASNHLRVSILFYIPIILFTFYAINKFSRLTRLMRIVEPAGGS